MPRIVCSYDTDASDVWRLEADYARITSQGLITVPTGFVWDGASVPRQIWNLIPPWGSYSGAALVHDWMYDQKIGRRSDADRVFLELMIEDGVPPDQAAVMYRAVRVFGSEAWNT